LGRGFGTSTSITSDRRLPKDIYEQELIHVLEEMHTLRAHRNVTVSICVASCDSCSLFLLNMINPSAPKPVVTPLPSVVGVCGGLQSPCPTGQRVFLGSGEPSRPAHRARSLAASAALPRHPRRLCALLPHLGAHPAFLPLQMETWDCSGPQQSPASAPDPLNAEEHKENYLWHRGMPTRSPKELHVLRSTDTSSL